MSSIRCIIPRLKVSVRGPLKRLETLLFAAAR